MLLYQTNVKDLKQRKWFRPQGLQHMFFIVGTHGLDDGLDARPLDFCRTLNDRVLIDSLANSEFHGIQTLA